MTEIEQQLPQTKEFEVATTASAKVSEAKDQLEKSSTITSDVIKLINDIVVGNVSSLTECLTNVKNFIGGQVEGVKLSKDKCEETLAQLKELETKLEAEKVKTGDQSIAELGTQQVKLLKKTWEVIKETCDLTEDVKKRLPIIDEQIRKMEAISEQINKFIDAYNNGEYSQDEENKAIILEQINFDYERLRTNYIKTRREIDTLNVSINGQLLKLDFLDSDHNSSILQNGIACSIMMFQGFAKKAATVASAVSLTACANNITQSLNAKASISQARNQLKDLKEKIDALEVRVAAVKQIKEKAEKFLQENVKGFKLRSDDE